jgi:hypothetical protein
MAEIQSIILLKTTVTYTALKCNVLTTDIFIHRHFLILEHRKLRQQIQPISPLLVSEQLQIYSKLLSSVSSDFSYNQKFIYISLVCFLLWHIFTFMMTSVSTLYNAEW